MAPFDERLRHAAEIAAADRRIRVTDIEARLGPTTYTADTLRRCAGVSRAPGLSG